MNYILVQSNQVVNFVCARADRMYNDKNVGASHLVVIALAHGFSFFAAVASAMNVSGGHVNPAVTFGALVGGRISVLHAVYYWIGQLLGAVVASLLLRFSTDGMVTFNIHSFVMPQRIYLHKFIA